MTRPFSDSDLHALVDHQLDPTRERELDAWLVDHPEEARRVADYRAQKRELRELFDPVLDEVPPARLLRTAPAVWRFTAWPEPLRMAAGLLLAVVSAAGGWVLRGELAPAPLVAMAVDDGLPRRAAVAHAVYTPELRRPVEVDAAHEDQLVTWLSRRMGAPMKPPKLQSLGYALEGGRLLPGGDGPVAQFMYRDEAGRRLTLYVSREAKAAPAGAAFRFSREGALNVFYWVDGPFGYALSAAVDRADLERVSSEVYKQLGGS